MRIAIASLFLVSLATAQTQPAWRAIPFAQGDYLSDGGGMNGDWTVGSGFRPGVGAQGTIYIPQEDSMGWAVQVEANGGWFDGDLEGTMSVPDGTESGKSLTQATYSARLQTGPFYRFLGLWGNSGGVFGGRWQFSEGEKQWYREDECLLFGVYNDFGSSPWAREGFRAGVMLGRLGGSQNWEGIYLNGAVSDSSQWLREGFEGEFRAEYWRGPVWAQLVADASTANLRHRSEEGSKGDGTQWTIGLRVGYRFAMGNLEGFR